MSPAPLQPSPQVKQNPKLDQFLKDLNKLLEHYQYALVPSLDVRVSGIIPALRIIDKPPKPLDLTPKNPAKKADLPIKPADEAKPTAQVAPVPASPVTPAPAPAQAKKE